MLLGEGGYFHYKPGTVDFDTDFKGVTVRPLYIEFFRSIFLESAVNRDLPKSDHVKFYIAIFLN
jgi:hypothetical protein